MKVREAESSAIATANGASIRRSVQPVDSAGDESRTATDVSALVIPAMVIMLTVSTSAGSGLMHSYHNVAELRQFRGAFCRLDRQSPAAFWPTGKVLTPNQALAPAAVDLNVEVPDLLPQRVAVQP